MTSIRDALREAEAALTASDSPRLDAEILLCHVLGKNRSHLFAWPEQALTAEQAERFRSLLQRRAAGEPVAHIIGEREFWSLPLKVSPATLIPRPETELLVERALERLQGLKNPKVADLGTGSGAIALAIASERPDAEITATDFSPEALAVAEENARRLGLRVRFLQGAWYAPLGTKRFDLIVSNPPYIPQHDPHLTRGDARFDPRSALAAGADGLDDLRILCAGAHSHLRPGGWLLVEHGYDQGESVPALFRAAGLQQVSLLHDLEGRPRVTEGQIQE